MRILQLSDPHLLADPRGRCRGREALPLLRRGLEEALRQLAGAGTPADLLLLSGDLCQDESWGGYVRLRSLLAELPLPAVLLPGNHDHPRLLQACLARVARVGPGLVRLRGWELLLLDSHRPGCVEGWLGKRQLAAIAPLLRSVTAGPPLLVAVHHPPVPIGDPGFDAIGLRDGDRLLELLRPCGRLRGLVFGHVHQHWQGHLPGRPEVPLLGCPSTLAPFGPVQPCPLGRSADPGGRLLELTARGEIRQRLLRWSCADPTTVG